MAKCKESGRQTCSYPDGCFQRHFEFLLVDDQGHSGDAIESFCLSTLTPQQLTLLSQFVQSVTNKAPLLKTKPCRSSGPAFVRQPPNKEQTGAPIRLL